MKIKVNKLLIFMILLSLIGTALIYNTLPETIPKHWNLYGQVDAYANKNFIWFTTLLPMILYLVMIFVPRIDPKASSYNKHKKAYEIFIFFLVIFLIGLHWLTIFSSLKYNISIKFFINIFLGILFIAIGNYMGQIRQNYTFGIKTPWTLHNEIVWKKTHRIGGFLFVILGILYMITGIFIKNKLALTIPLIATMVVCLYLTLYSYIEFKKLQNSNK